MAGPLMGNISKPL